MLQLPEDDGSEVLLMSDESDIPQKLLSTGIFHRCPHVQAVDCIEETYRVGTDLSRPCYPVDRRGGRDKSGPYTVSIVYLRFYQYILEDRVVFTLVQKRPTTSINGKKKYSHVAS